MSASLIGLYAKVIRLSGVICKFGFWFFAIFTLLSAIIIIVTGDKSHLGTLVLFPIAAIGCRYWQNKASSSSFELAEMLFEKAKLSRYSGQSIYLAVKPVIDEKIESIKVQKVIRDEYESNKKKFLANISSRENFQGGLKVLVQGGAGWGALSGREALLSLDNENAYLAEINDLQEYTINFNEVVNVEVGGPGSTTAGGGFAGGGFGVQGFLVGAAAAAVLNLLTTRTTTKTIVRIDTQDSEVFLLIDSKEPEEMRIMLSPLFVRVTGRKKFDPEYSNSIVAQLVQLNSLKDSGAVSEDEYERVKASLLRGA